MGWVNRLSVVLFALMLVLAANVAPVALAQDPSDPAFQQAIRADMETLANQAFGVGIRPETWTGNADSTAPNYLADLYYDNEQLADEVFGLGQRADDWFGASSPMPVLIYRNVRHDLELTADAFFGETVRPEEWIGSVPLIRCDRALQDIVMILRRDYDIEPSAITQVVNYCAVVKAEIEDRLFNDVLRELTQTQLTPDQIGGLRGDLERLADERLGLDTRPGNWIGNRVDGSPTFLSDVFVDLDTLADNQLGIDIRPLAWIGTISASPLISYRNIRFDIESLADATLGEGVRPRGWQGTDPLTRCDTTLQTLVTLINVTSGGFVAVVDSNQTDNEIFCRQVYDLAIQTAETELQVDEVAEGIPDGVIWESRNAFSYLDVTALEYMGVMPWDIEFRPWFRNFQESTMMFVTGDDFALFIDRRWTTMPEEAFIRLPNLEGRQPRTFCDATWCNGPQPTPTPTGSGPIIALFEAATPVATSAATPSGPVPTGKTLVTWNNIRVTYLLDNAVTRTVQVALEICAEPAQVTCEPVLTVFDGNAGLYKPVIQQYNGLNVFEMGYGYQTNVTIEGATRYSRDIFISEPGLR
jgi:hypothetical protein